MSFTLDSIRAAAEAKYGSYDIDIDGTTTCRLLNPLRLSKENRDALQATQTALEAEGADQAVIMAEAIRLVAATPSQAEALLGAVEGDLAILAQIFQGYSEGTQAGEA